MTLQRRMRSLLKSLPPSLHSEHFSFHYGLLNPLQGTGLGAHGVRNKVIIVAYVEALEALYKAMTSPPWSRTPPVTDATGCTHVYVLDSSPLTAITSDEIPFIVLSCRSNEPTTQGELHRAAAEAVHEGTHLFNYTERPMSDPNSGPWVWFDEGLAMLMEMLVVPGNPDYFRFLMNWIDMPEIPLDDPEGQYQSGMFIRYLANKMGAAFVNSVWTKSRIKESPIDTLQRLMPKGQKFISANPADRDLFASGYCLDPYFIWEHGHGLVAPDVFIRYGERAISESKLLNAKYESQIKGRLDHLACRYYRFFLKSGVSNVEIAFQPQVNGVPTPFKAEVTIVNKNTQRSESLPLRAKKNGNLLKGPLHATLTALDPDEIDHLVMVVSNCGTKSYNGGDVTNHDDGKEFTIQVTAS
jgi:hypothetical protein